MGVVVVVVVDVMNSSVIDDADEWDLEELDRTKCTRWCPIVKLVDWKRLTLLYRIVDV